MRKRHAAMLVGAALSAVAGTAAANPGQPGFGIYFGAPAPVYSAPHAPVYSYAPRMHAAPPVYAEPARGQHGSARFSRYEGPGSYDHDVRGGWDRRRGH